nr:hypothetical protein [Tanacetum cinerariifolium]
MAPLTFADTHSMVAFLSTSDASTCFDQIVDFFNAHTIQYALVVNPTIYVSCINQFWATATIKKNELSCFMASAVICLATEEKGKEVRKEKEIKALRIQEAKKGKIDQDDEVNAASKGVSATEPTVFDDEEVTITMAQTLIKMKAEKARLLDEQIAQRKYQNLKKKPVYIAQSRKNMIIYLKNMAGYKMEHFRGMTYDKVRPIFEKEYKKVKILFKPYKDVEEPKKKRVTEETLLQESFKKLKAVEVSGSESTQETPSNDPKEMSEEDVQNMLEIVPVSEFKVEALQSFKDMLKGFDREDLVALCSLVKEKFSLAIPSVDKEKALWVELKDYLNQMQMMCYGSFKGKVDTAAEVTEEITLSS